MTTKKLPLGTSARLFVEEIIRFQKQLHRIHIRMVGADNEETRKGLLESALDLDDKIEDLMGDLYRIYEEAARDRVREG